MSSIDNLLEIMARLREPNTGCPWDRQQDFASIAPYTIEEAYEVADAIDRDDLKALRDELGDLLFQVVFHAQMATEADAFDFEAVAKGICDKLVRRHPHVFGSEAERSRGATPGTWERIKAEERSEAVSLLDGVAKALPALKRAEKLGKRAATGGFDWPDVGGVRDKVDEELAELDEAHAAGDPDRVQEELGDLLFAITNLARHVSVDPEQALVAANRKFERRFRRMEAAVRDSGSELTDFDIDALEQRWRAAKDGG